MKETNPFLLLFNLDNPDDATLFLLIHGYLTSFVVCFEQPDISMIFDHLPEKEASTLSSISLSDLKKMLIKEIQDIDQRFNNEDFSLAALTLAMDNETYLSFWCFGFMEGHLLMESDWFKHSSQEQAIFELLFPIMLSSELFDEVPEFKSVLKNKALTADIKSQIPDVLIELYILFRSIK